MAERFAGFEQPTPVLDAEVKQFAKGLYNYLWIRFKVIVPGTAQTLPIQENPFFTEAIGIGVLCEQLLMRQVVLREVFFTWALVIVSDPDFIYILCLALYRNGFTWSFSKRFFRCCAIISEFFLFRSDMLDGVFLGRAEKVLKVVFDNFFKNEWSNCGGWRELDQFARERINPIYHRFEYYVDNINDPLDYFPPIVERLPRWYEKQYKFASFHDEVSAAFSSLVDMFLARNSEEASNLLRKISLMEDEDNLPRFEPIGRPISPIESTSEEKTCYRIKPVHSTRVSPVVPIPKYSAFSPIVQPTPSTSGSHSSGSTPLYRPTPQKASENLSLEMVRDGRSAADDPSPDEPMEMDMTEELPQHPARKRTISPGNPVEDDPSKKCKN